MYGSSRPALLLAVVVVKGELELIEMLEELDGDADVVIADEMCPGDSVDVEVRLIELFVEVASLSEVVAVGHGP